MSSGGFRFGFFAASNEPHFAQMRHFWSQLSVFSVSCLKSCQEQLAFLAASRIRTRFPVLRSVTRMIACTSCCSLETSKRRTGGPFFRLRFVLFVRIFLQNLPPPSFRYTDSLIPVVLFTLKRKKKYKRQFRRRIGATMRVKTASRGSPKCAARPGCTLTCCAKRAIGRRT